MSIFGDPKTRDVAADILAGVILTIGKGKLQDDLVELKSAISDLKTATGDKADSDARLAQVVEAQRQLDQRLLDVQAAEEGAAQMVAKANALAASRQADLDAAKETFDAAVAQHAEDIKNAQAVLDAQRDKIEQLKVDADQALADAQKLKANAQAQADQTAKDAADLDAKVNIFNAKLARYQQLGGF